MTVAIVDGIFVNGSAALLNQLVANSVANIRRHTSSDVPVNISLSAEDDMAVLVIEDGGPGLTNIPVGRINNSANSPSGSNWSGSANV